MLKIFVDADGCPVKEEIYRVARRHRLDVVLVANARMHLPADEAFEMVVVDGRLDAADDWIAGHAGTGDIVVTADIPLASRCLKNGSLALRPNGREFNEENIGEALATRELMSHLRDLGEMRGGPAPFDGRDRSRFLHRLDEMIRSIRRR